MENIVCMVCTDWLKGKMTSEEALRALGEMIHTKGEYSEDSQHYLDIAGQILDKEVPSSKEPSTTGPKKTK